MQHRRASDLNPLLSAQIHGVLAEIALFDQVGGQAAIGAAGGRVLRDTEIVGVETHIEPAIRVVGLRTKGQYGFGAEPLDQVIVRCCIYLHALLCIESAKRHDQVENTG